MDVGDVSSGFSGPDQFPANPFGIGADDPSDVGGFALDAEETGWYDNRSVTSDLPATWGPTPEEIFPSVAQDAGFNDGVVNYSEFLKVVAYLHAELGTSYRNIPKLVYAIRFMAGHLSSALNFDTVEHAGVALSQEVAALPRIR